MYPVDTKNQEEEAKVVDILVRCGAYSIDDAMEHF
jgi:hypothetical protein